MKCLLVVGAGHESVYGIRIAKEMGLHVVASDRDVDAPGLKAADNRIFADTYDAEQTARLARIFSTQQHQIHGVISFASDVPVTVATVAAWLDVPGLPIETARLAADKWLQKQALWKADIPTPFGFLADTPETIYHTLRYIASRGPIGSGWVVKPADSRGARGVIRLSLPRRIEEAWAEAKSYSQTGRVICEEWIEGPQVSTETIAATHTVGFLDRNYDRLEEFYPYVIEDGATQPSTLTATKQHELKALAERAAVALGFTHIAKGDLVYGPRGPMVIEMAARLSGGLMSSVQVPESTGVKLVENAIRLALGEPIRRGDLMPSKQKAVAMRFFFPPPGKVISVNEDVPEANGPIVAARVPRVGQIVEPVTDHTKRAGYVVAVADTRAGAIRQADNFIKRAGVRTCTNQS